jgi:hypothetical protein
METMDVGIEYNPTRQDSLLNADDYREMADFAQNLTGIRSSCGAIRIIHPSEIKDHQGNVYPMSELSSMCDFINTPEGLQAEISLPTAFSSAQSEIEIASHEITHSVINPFLELQKDQNVAYVVKEYVCDVVATHFRQEIMEDNTEPGVVAGAILYEGALSGISRDKISEYLETDVTDKTFLDPDETGHFLGRKMVAALNPLHAAFGDKNVVRAVLLNPPSRGELYDLTLYRKRITKELETNSFDTQVELAPISVVVE